MKKDLSILSKGKKLDSGMIKESKNKKSVRLSTVSNSESFICLLRDVLRDSGFFLFILILDSVLIRFGMLLNFHLGPYFGFEP